MGDVLDEEGARMGRMFMISVGEWSSENSWTYDDQGRKWPSMGMKVYSRVQLTSETGVNEPWICDSFLKKIGAGQGTWTLKPSSKELFLWGKHLEYQAKLKYASWPLKKDATGDFEVRHGIYGRRNLSYWVDIVRAW
jgi:hypothetical protein